MLNKLFGAVTLAVVAGLPSFAAWAAPSDIPAQEQLTAALMPGVGREARVAPLPTPLSEADAIHYAEVFRLQSEGRWDLAQRELAKVNDPLLKGHVLARQYLTEGRHPSPSDIRAWLADYSDLPQAAEIQSRSVSRPKHLTIATADGSARTVNVDTSDDGANWEEAIFDLDGKTVQGRAYMVKLRKALHGGRTDQVAGILHEAMVKGIDGSDMNEMKVAAAFDLFIDGNAAEAASLASEAADDSGEDLPAAHWIAGLSEWRAGRADLARLHFEHLASIPDAEGWMISAGAFWAARSNLVSHHPELVNHWLEVAATYPRSFYGLMARRVLGYETLFAWNVPPFTEGDAEMLMRVPGGKRAMALVQIGEHQAAEDELRHVSATAGKALRQSMLVMAQRSDMPNLAVYLGGMTQGKTSDAVSYPLPHWMPRGGWTMDKALVFAFVRQESRFNPLAHSGRGASGLMQLMPATATAIAGSHAREHLTDPEYNLEMGQRYLSKLMTEEPVNGNLMFLAAAYNAGPGKLQQWIDAFGKTDDPLLFMESLPSRQTRTFVERIMTNYWIYRGRMGLPSPSLDQIASGHWPTYDGSDFQPRVRNASTR